MTRHFGRSVIGLLAVVALSVTVLDGDVEAQRRGRRSGRASKDCWAEGGKKVELPADSVAAGSTPASHVCRVKVGSVWVPGAARDGRCEAVHRGNVVLEENSYQILTGSSKVQWKAASGHSRSAPNTAFFSGRERGREVYICRAHDRGQAFLGRVEKLRRCRYIDDGNVASATDFDYLVAAETGSAQGDRGKGGCDPSSASLSGSQLKPDGDELYGNDIMRPVSIRGAGHAVIIGIEQDECTFLEAERESGADALLIDGGRMARVRAQRLTDGDGRIYFVKWKCDDGDDAGAGDDGDVFEQQLCVPLAAGGSCVDSGVRFDSTARSYTDLVRNSPQARELCRR